MSSVRRKGGLSACGARLKPVDGKLHVGALALAGVLCLCTKDRRSQVTEQSSWETAGNTASQVYLDRGEEAE